MGNRLIRINLQNQKYKQPKGHGLTTLPAIFLSIMIALLMPIFFMPTKITALSNARSGGGNSETIRIDQLTINDWEGNEVSVGQENDFTQSISGILNGLNSGEVGASQFAYYETLEDEQNGIIKNTVDVAADPMSGSMDVVFVLDASGSMANPFTGVDALPENSPPDPDPSPNEDARFYIAKQSILRFSESVLLADGDSRISIVVFSTGIDSILDFTEDLESIHSYIASLNYGQNTNYESGLNQAEALLNNRSGAERERESHVILITDGRPNRGNAVAGANRLKNNTNADLYCVGIESGAGDLLASLATDESYFKDCNTVNEFMEYMIHINERLPAYQSAVIQIELGNFFNLLCDETHPIDFGETTYFSIDDLPADLSRFHAESNRIQWTIPTITNAGLRISYYTSLTDEAKTDSDAHPTCPLFAAGNLEYHRQLRVDDGTVQTAEESTSKTLLPYTLHAKSSTLTLSIFSDQMGTDDSFRGNDLSFEDEIQYTVRVTNDGLLTAEQIEIGAYIPFGSEYVSGVSALPDHDNLKVSSTPFTLLPGETEEISFIVRVSIEEGFIANTGFLNLIHQDSNEMSMQTGELTNFVVLLETAPPITNPPSSILPPTQVPQPPSTQVPQPPSTQVPQPPSTQVPQPSSTQVPQPPSTQVPQPPSTQVPQPPSTQVVPPTVIPETGGPSFSAQVTDPVTMATDEMVGTKQREVGNPSVVAGSHSSEENIDSARQSAVHPADESEHQLGDADSATQINNVRTTKITENRQSDANRNLEGSTTTNSYTFLLVASTLLCIVLVTQIIHIRSDLRLLSWYQSKKTRHSDHRNKRID